MVLEGNGRVPIPSKRFDVWQRLYQRYTLEPGPVGELSAPALSTLVVPTTSADRLLSMPDIRVSTFVVDAQETTFAVSVPAGERWLVRYVRVALVDGTWTHDRFDLQDPGGASIPINNYTQTATAELYEPFSPFTLDQAWQIRVNVDTFSVAGNGQVSVYIEVEDAF